MNSVYNICIMSATACFLLFLFALMFLTVLCASGHNEMGNYPCELSNSVLISDDYFLENGSVIDNGILYNSNQYFSLNLNGSQQIRGCTCLVQPCVMKCCPLGRMGLKKCLETDHPFEVPVYAGIDLLVGYTVYAQPVRLNCSKFRATNIYLQANGSLLVMESKIPTIYTRDEYCVDFVELPDKVKGTTYRLDALLCFPEQEKNEVHATKLKILSRAMLISVPFLVATLVVYCILPELHNLHGYIMITYLSSLLAFFLFLAAVQISAGEFKIVLGACLFLDFAVYFTAMASFFWMNVMCFDIWWTFSGQRTWQGIGMGSRKQRYMFYSIYAWVISMLLTCILAYMQFNKNLWDDYIYPGFGVRNCWFHDATSQLMYMYLPIGILLGCNLVLFSATTYRIFSISRETRMLQENQSKKRTFEKERQRFFLYIKLFTVMGLNWILEIASFLIHNESEGWIVSDVFNSLIGVFIFIIFVLKKKILKLLVKRYQKLRYGTTVSIQTKSCSESCQSSFVLNSRKEKQLLALEQPNPT